MTNKTPLGATVLDALPGVKLICVLATGVNVVDVQHARDKGVPVCNVPEYGTAAVAQFTMALILALSHRVEQHAAAVRSGAWISCPDFSFWENPQVELDGLTMGIVGMGRIGQRVARLAVAVPFSVVASSASAGASSRVSTSVCDSLIVN